MTEAPDLAAPVAGWRVWRLGFHEGEPHLVSPYTPAVWPHRAATTARCGHGCERPPSRRCRCGLYALADVERLALAARTRDRMVVGCVALWGRVVEHADGWRGEYGYPLVLFTGLGRGGVDDDDDDPIRRSLVQRYGVPSYRAPFPLRWLSCRSTRHAAAVRDEAARGLATRRLGDPDARERLRRTVENLFDARPDPEDRSGPARPR